MDLGTYKPQIHTHHLPHLSLSYARHTISLNKTFVLLSSDYTKSLHLQADRSLEFHTPSGCHYTTRIPRYGRDLLYSKVSAEALIPAVGINENGNGEVFRLNLEAGRFMRGYEVDVGGDDTSKGNGLQGSITAGAVNVAATAEDTHGLLAFGTTLGTTEFWDPRSRQRAGVLQSPVQYDPIDGRQETTALQFDRSGLGLATGSSTGLIHLYDLRSPLPILKKDQGYGYAIQDIIYLTSSGSSRSQVQEPKIMSSDKRIVKIWDAQDGSPWTSVEPAVDINKIAWCPDSGMVLTANEGRQQHAFFIPQLGPAPKWCSFLDNLVEEMAEDPNDPNSFQSQKVGEIYDNFKFLTPSQLETLNLSHLIGTTNLLRPYMHGYFVAQRLYEEAKLIADPFVFEEQRNKRVKQKIDAERESRIRGNKKVTTKVNQKLAEKLLERHEKEERKRARNVLQNGGDEAITAMDDELPTTVGEELPTKELEAPPNNILTDPRFAKLFEDDAFAIDEHSHEFRSLNPSTKVGPRITTENKDDRKLTAVEEEALDTVPASSDSNTSDSESDAPAHNKPAPKPKPSSRISDPAYKKSGHQRQQHLTMSVSSSNKFGRPKDTSFGERVKGARVERPRTSNVVGEKSVSFAPSSRRKKPEVVMERGERRSNKDRRSASGNVMRNL